MPRLQEGFIRLFFAIILLVISGLSPKGPQTGNTGLPQKELHGVQIFLMEEEPSFHSSNTLHATLCVRGWREAVDTDFGLWVFRKAEGKPSCGDARARARGPFFTALSAHAYHLIHNDVLVTPDLEYLFGNFASVSSQPPPDKAQGGLCSMWWVC